MRRPSPALLLSSAASARPLALPAFALASSSTISATAVAPRKLLAMNEATSSSEQPLPAPSAAGAITFEEVVERYHEKVFQLIFRYTGDYEESCDLTQDTFVRAYRAWREFRGDSQIYTWLYRIALNLCHNSRKKGDRKRRVEGISLDGTPGDDDEKSPGMDVADARQQPSRTLENDELRARLHDALTALPDNYRTVIVLRDIEGLSYEEIARITDSTLEAIKSRLFRARTMLREMLSPYLFGVSEENRAASSGRAKFSWSRTLRRQKKRPDSA